MALHSPCATHEDCLGDAVLCQGYFLLNKTCGCSALKGMAGPQCEDLGTYSIAAIVARSLVICCYMVPGIHAAITLVRERSRQDDWKRRSASGPQPRPETLLSHEQLAMLACTTCACVLLCAYNVTQLYDMLGGVVHKRSVALAEVLLEGVGLTLGLVAVHFFSMIWCELCLQTNRMRSLRHGLVLSRRLSLGWMVVLVVCRAGLAVAELTYSANFYYANAAFLMLIEFPLVVGFFSYAVARLREIHSPRPNP
jgi:hypothetical protein